MQLELRMNKLLKMRELGREYLSVFYTVVGIVHTHSTTLTARGWITPHKGVFVI